jgi:hypothetical protein
MDAISRTEEEAPDLPQLRTTVELNRIAAIECHFGRPSVGNADADGQTGG